MKCQECGKVFTKRGSRGTVPKYCSAKCRNAPHVRRHGAAYQRTTGGGNTTGKCLACGAPVKQYKSSGLYAKTCNNKECKDAYRCAVHKKKYFAGRDECQCPECDKPAVEGNGYCHYHSLSRWKWSQCQMCHKPFLRTPSQRRHKKDGTSSANCCSRECGFEYQRLFPHAKPKLGPKVHKCPKCGKRQWGKSVCADCKTHLRKCVQCNKQFKATNKSAKVCSSECKRERDRLSSAEYKKQNPYVVDSGYFECAGCKRKAFAPTRRSQRKWCSLCIPKGNHRHRARLYGCEYDDTVSLKALLIRDNNKCQLCGCKVYRTKEWKANQATIEHIIPMSKGGGHTWQNVQLACQSCNSTKSNKTNGQLRLC